MRGEHGWNVTDRMRGEHGWNVTDRMRGEHGWNVTDRIKPKYPVKNLSQFHFEHQESHIKWPGFE
jgi:hypothetical protein